MPLNKSERLARLCIQARILGIPIDDILEDEDAIKSRVGTYKKASASNAMSRPGFMKTSRAVEAPCEVVVEDQISKT